MMWNLPEEAEDLVDDVASVMAMEGMYLTPGERNMFLKVSVGEMTVDEALEAIRNDAVGGLNYGFE